MKDPLVSIIIVVYNNQDYIKRCIDSVLSAKYEPKEILVIDNASTDNSPTILSKFGNKIKLISNASNTGYAQANNQGVKFSKGKYLFILNPDTVVTANFLEPLITTAETSSKIAACQPAIFLLHNKHTLNLSGKQTHYLGFDWIVNFESTTVPPKHEMVSFSGCGILINKEAMIAAHMFDESYFMYYEDTDLSWKFRLLGYSMVFVPQSKIFHDYKLFPPEKYLQSKRKMSFLERNRLATVLKNYSAKTLVIIFIPLVTIELAMTLFALINGWFFTKIKGYSELWRSRAHLLKERAFIQNKRTVSDRAIVSEFSPTIDFVYASNPVIKYLLNPLLCMYWQIFGKLV